MHVITEKASNHAIVLDRAGTPILQLLHARQITHAAVLWLINRVLVLQMAAAGEEAARRCFSDNLLRKAVRDYSRTSAAASAPAGPSKYTDHSVISGAACAAPDFNLHSCSDVELELSGGDRQYCGDVSTLAAQSTSSLIQKEAAVAVDEDLHSWEHSISSTTSNCMSGHRNSCSEVDEVNLERSTSRSPSSRSMQSLQVNSTSSRSKNNMEAAASCWGAQLNITTDCRHHHLHHAADYTSPGTSPAAFLYLPTAPPLAAASSIKENNPTNNLELSFKSSRDQHHGNLIKELHEISRQFFPAASHGSCRSPTTTTSGSRSSSTASQLVQRPPPPPVHNFLSDHYGDHQLVPCSWRTTSSMNAATAAAAAGTSTTSSSAASTLQVDELAAAVQLLPCSSNKLQQYAVPMSSSRFSTDESNLQLHIIKQHQQQPYFNFSDTFDMDLMKTRPHHIPMDQRQQQQQQEEEDHHVENSMISRHEYYNNQINPAGLNFNQLQVTSDLELPAAAATGAYLRTQLREPISSSYNNNAAAAIVASSSACTGHVAAPHQTLMSSFAAAATGSLSALSSSSFTSSAGPAAAAAAALHISNFSSGAPDPPLTMAMTTPASGMNSIRVHGHHSYDHQNIQTSRVQVLWDFQE